MLKHCNALQPIANRAALLACLVLSPTTWAIPQATRILMQHLCNKQRAKPYQER